MWFLNENTRNYVSNKMTTRALQKKCKDIRRIARAHGITQLRVFGSFANGHATGQSDLDLLVRVKPNRDLRDLIGFKQDVEDLLECKVDVVSENGLSPYLRDRILESARPL